MEQFNMFKISTFFLLLIGIQESRSFAIFAGLTAIREIASFGDDIADISNGEVPFGALLIGSEDYKLDQVLDKVDAISDQVAELTKTVNTKMDKILTVLLKRIPLQGKLDQGMDKFHSIIVRVDGLWAQYKKISKKIKKYNKRTVKSFIKSITSFDTGDLPNVLNKMHRLFVPTTSGYFQDGLLRTLSNFQNEAEPVETCTPDYSFQHRLFQIYKTIVTTEIRGFVMTVFVYMYLTVKNKDPYPAELEAAVANLVLRSKDYLTSVQKEMATASREIKTCGAERIPYDQLGEFVGLQSWIILNEVQAQEDMTCYYTCGDISTHKVWYNYPLDYKPRIDCIGKIHDCSWAGTTTMCDQPDDSPKRYEKIDTQNGRYGPEFDCPWDRRSNVDWWTSGISRCDVCACRCFQEDATAEVIRTFSLRPQVSDTENNMVVVGVKFTAKDDMIHLQIQQAKLLPQGEIDKSTEEWVELEDFVYLSNVTGGGFSLANGESLTRGRDFTFITWDQQQVNLDDVLVTTNKVITGVRFNHEEEDDYNSPVEIQVRATFFDYEYGIIESEIDSHEWYNANNMHIKGSEYSRKRTENIFYNYNPMTSTMNEPLTKPNEYVKFIASNLRTTAGNFTLPLFDLRPVTATPSVPLGGVGMYVKGSEDHGSFFGLKVFNFDFSEFIDSALDEEQMKSYEKAVSAEEESEEEDDDDDDDDDDD